jgi:hypothetical protein
MSATGTVGNDAIAFFRLDAKGNRVPAEAPPGNPGGAAYFDASDYNYEVSFSSMNVPVGSVYPNRRPRLSRNGWVES